MQGLKYYFILMSDKSSTKLEVMSLHDHSFLLGCKASNQTNKQITHSKQPTTKALTRLHGYLGTVVCLG